ncbi:MAG TPA: SpoIIE family protein phosphatase [Spirochaetota bacterium]|nr:SpoIIE family protein phosphatase [Spirochaetota bacterium]
MNQTLLGEKIAGRYRLSSLIGEGGMSRVFEAEDLHDESRRVAVKILKTGTVSARLEDVIRFRNEAEIVSRLDHPGIVHIYQVGQHRGMHYLVTEYLEGACLAALLGSGKVEIRTTITLMACLAEALRHIHDKGIIHRDIKPANIIVHEEGRDGYDASLTLIDFGLARIREFSRMEDSDEIVGTFAYMSPEQSGVLKRKVDERSDLYSLGIIMYQMLTGVLPFSGGSISSLLHQQIARVPEPPSRIHPAIPPAVEKIVLRLVEKEPERRYQSARGLLADLARVLAGEENFLPGRDDVSVRFSFQTGLIGREAELATLLRCHDNVREGRGRVCLVAGEAGRGKTRLVEEFSRCTLDRGTMVLTGKSSAGGNTVPFGMFREIVEQYLDAWERKNEGDRAMTGARLREMLGAPATLVTSLHAGAARLFGDLPPLVPLDSDRENKRFLATMAAFFCTLAMVEGGLVLVLEDLHWIDQGSADILLEILDSCETTPLEIVGTWRDGEIDAHHSLVALLPDSGRQDVVHLSCDAFDVQRMAALVGAVLHADPGTIGEIAEFVLNRSRGNPFFAVEILRQLLAGRVLASHGGLWRIDRRRLDSVSVSGTLLEMIMNRISALDPKEHLVLSHAAAIGRKFGMQLLFSLFRDPPDMEPLSEQALVRVIDHAIEMQILEVLPGQDGVLSFVHDRIREVFYRQADHEAGRRLHANILRAMESGTSPGDDTDVASLFEMAHHAIEAGDADAILRLARPAAEKARQAYANRDALRYHKAILAVLGEDAANQDHPGHSLRLESSMASGEVLLVTGQNDQAIACFENILAKKIVQDVRIEAHLALCRAWFRKGDWARCETMARKGLALLGEHLPARKFSVGLGILREFAIHLLHLVFPFVFVRSTEKKDGKTARKIIEFYVNVGWSFILSDTTKFVHSILRMVNLSRRKIGPSRELGVSLGSYASLCMAIPLFGRALHYHEKALGLRGIIGDEWGVAQSLQFLGFCHEWRGEYERGIECFRRSAETFRRIGDSRELGMALVGLVHCQYYLSRYPQAMKDDREYREMVTRSHDRYGISDSHVNALKYHIEMGNFEEAAAQAEACSTHSSADGIWFIACVNAIYRGILAIETGDPKTARTRLEEARNLYEKGNFLKQYTVHLYAWRAKAGLDLARRMSQGKERRKALSTIYAELRQARSRMRAWPTHRSELARFFGEYHELAGHAKRARRWYDEAVKLARKTRRRYEEGKALHVWGLFEQSAGAGPRSTELLMEAWRVYSGIGAAAGVRQVGDLLEIRPEQDQAGRTKILDRHRLSTIIRLGQDVSSLLDPADLLESIIEKSVEVTGAQRGFLMLYGNDGQKLEVRAARGVSRKDLGEISSGIVQEVIRQGETIVSGDAALDERYTRFRSVAEHGLKSVLCAPIRLYEKIAGACYLDNPLTSGVFDEEDAQLLGLFMTQAAIALENAELYRNLERKVEERTAELETALEIQSELNRKLVEASEELKVYTDALEKRDRIIREDLLMARRIQTSILPAQTEARNGFRVSVSYLPMEEVGGDFYDYFILPDGRLRLLIADATGHGVQAALVTMLVKSVWDGIRQTVGGPGDVLEMLNRETIERFGSLTMFFTCAVVDIDRARGRIDWASAGHPAQYLRTGTEVQLLGHTGMIIGLNADAVYETREAAWKTGSLLLLCTDGILEQCNTMGEEFGEERLRNLLILSGKMSSVGMLDLVGTELEKFMGGSLREDDITMLSVTDTGGAETCL